MADIKHHRCGFCCGLITDDGFTLIEEVVLDALFRKQDVNNVCKIVCCVCSPKLYTAFEFKSKCLDTNNTIKMYTDSQTVPQLDIRDIYKKEVGNEELSGRLDGKKVCRLCMKLVKTNNGFKSVQDIHDKIETYIPEIDFTFTTDPVACRVCFDTLLIHADFLKSCLNMQQVLMEYNESTQATCHPSEDFKMEIIEHNVKANILGRVFVKTEQEEDDRLQNATPEQLKDEDMSESKYRAFRVKEEHQDLPSSSESTSEELDLPSQAEGRVPDKLHEHRDTSKVKMYKCDKCDYETKHKCHLTRHQLIHKSPRDIKMFRCKDCSFKTKYKASYNQHQVKHMDKSQVKTYKCVECNFQSIHKYYLVKHMLIHRDESEVQMYKCEQCDYKTKYKKYLKEHRLRHTDHYLVKMYKCGECEFQTAFKRSIVGHVLIHRDESEVQMYKCDQCDYKAKCKNNLVRHQFKHADKSLLKIHKCANCNFQSFRKHSLTRHMVIHKNKSQVKTYKCDVCELETKHKTSMIRHMLKQHNSETKAETPSKEK